CEGIIKETKDADFIIHEATCLEGCEIYGHTPLPKLKEIFDKKRVIITHIPSQIEDKYSNLGDFILAFDGLIWNV
ncbi:MAG: MBL fold metallo-hydrolase, partial [Acidianus sp.]